MNIDVHAAPKKLKPVDRAVALGGICGIHAVIALTTLLGRGPTLRFGRLLGRLLYMTSGRLRNKMLLNLQLAYGDVLSTAEKRRIACRASEHFCSSWAELFFSAGPHRAKTIAAIGISGREHLDRALARGKGIIAVSAHMGTYPLIGTKLVKDGYSFIMVVRDLKTPGGSKMYDRCRELIEMPSLPTVPEKIFFKAALQVLRSNGILCLITDENKRRGGVFVDFFGRPASTAPGPAALARRTGAAVVPMFMVRNPDGTQTIHMYEHIVFTPSDDESGDVQKLTAGFTRAIEQQIRRDPAQWPWNNWRWRTQPHGQDDAAKIKKRAPLKKIKKRLAR